MVKQHVSESCNPVRRVLMRISVAALLCCLFTVLALAQDKTVPVGEEQHHRLVLENEYTRVFHVVVPPKEFTMIHQHDRDYVWVQIGAAHVNNARVGEALTDVKLNGGDVKFIKGGFAHRVTNVAKEPFVNVTIEVKKPSTKSECGAAWPGVQPEKGWECALVIESGFVGQGTNFVTDAVEARTYFTTGSGTGLTAHAENPSLLVAATRLRCVCGGQPETEMKAGDVAWLPRGTAADVSRIGRKGSAGFVLVSFN